MTALLRYQAALLVRSQRWLPPVILYAAFLAIGVQRGQPVLDSLGYTAAVLLPCSARPMRICVTNEPPAARSCTGAAAGPGRAHLACCPGRVRDGGAARDGGHGPRHAHQRPHEHGPPDPCRGAPGGRRGLLAALVGALVGTAVGALTNWPLLRSPGRAVPALLLGALLALVVAGSPARAAVTALVYGSQRATIPVPVLPLLAAGLLTAAATAVACALTTRRSA